jgi:hypothetical protein
MKRFALFPTRVTSGRLVWLAYYYEYKSLYDEVTGRPPINSLHFIWSETAQEKTWRLLKTTVDNNRNVWNNPVQ